MDAVDALIALAAGVVEAQAGGLVSDAPGEELPQAAADGIDGNDQIAMMSVEACHTVQQPPCAPGAPAHALEGRRQERLEAPGVRRAQRPAWTAGSLGFYELLEQAAQLAKFGKHVIEARAYQENTLGKQEN